MTMVYVILAAITVVLILVVIGAAVIWNRQQDSGMPRLFWLICVQKSMVVGVRAYYFTMEFKLAAEFLYY